MKSLRIALAYSPTIALFLFIPCFAGAQNAATDTHATEKGPALYPVTQHGKYGYINREGKLIVAARFDHADDFQDGMGLVETGGKFGFVDASGKLSIPLEFDNADDFSDGLALVIRGDKYGYINNSGKFAIPATRSYADIESINADFSEGFAVEKVGDKFGYIDKTGAQTIPAQFSDAEEFCGGLAPVKEEVRGNLLAGYINSSGAIAIPLQFSHALGFSEGLALVMLSDPSLPPEYIDTKGNVAFTQANALGNFHDGMAKVAETGSPEIFGFMNRTGTVVISPRFIFGKNFSEGLEGVVALDGTAGYIDTTGRTAIPLPEGTRGCEFHGGLARVLIGQKIAYIDKAGKYVWTATERPQAEWSTPDACW